MLLWNSSESFKLCCFCANIWCSVCLHWCYFVYMLKVPLLALWWYLSMIWYILKCKLYWIFWCLLHCDHFAVYSSVIKLFNMLAWGYSLMWWHIISYIHTVQSYIRYEILFAQHFVYLHVYAFLKVYAYEL